MLNHTMLLDYQPKSYMFFVFIIGKCVLFQVIVQFQPSATPDEWGTSQDGQARPRVVKRGIDDDHDDIPDGMCLVCGGSAASAVSSVQKLDGSGWSSNALFVPRA